MDSSGLHPIVLYTKMCQTTISERVSCWPLYALRTEAEIIPGTILMVCWWDQDALKELKK